MLALSLILVGLLFRFVPHAPNFTPIAAIALFAGAYLNKRPALLIPLILMVISDLIMGIHDVVLFTWGSFLLVSLIGFWLKNNRSVARIFTTSILASLVFYLATNFGVWLMGWYPHTLKGLIDCYVLAIPFARNFTAATLVYSAVMFGAYGLVGRLVKNTKFSKVLLTE